MLNSSQKTQIPKDRARAAPFLAAWPEADREAWQAALQEGDFLDVIGAAAQWSRVTRLSISKRYTHWLTWLARNQDSLFLPLAERVTQEAVASYIEDLKARVSSKTVQTYLQGLRSALVVMAPDRDWNWLRRIVARLAKRAVQSRNKHQRIQPSNELFAYGLELMGVADLEGSGTSVTRARQFRDGLIFAMLAARPLRLRNFAAIQINNHLVRQGSGYCLRFAADETKTRRAIEVPIPDALLAGLERYLTHHRRVLCATSKLAKSATKPVGPGQALWVTHSAAPMSPEAIFHCVTKWSKARFGRSINPQLFRDCAATTIATEDPEHVRITMSILGHTSLRTSELHYNHAQSVEAARRYQREIARRRRPMLHDGS